MFKNTRDAALRFFTNDELDGVRKFAFEMMKIAVCWTAVFFCSKLGLEPKKYAVPVLVSLCSMFTLMGCGFVIGEIKRLRKSLPAEMDKQLRDWKLDAFHMDYVEEKEFFNSRESIDAKENADHFVYEGVVYDKLKLLITNAQQQVLIVSSDVRDSVEYGNLNHPKRFEYLDAIEDKFKEMGKSRGNFQYSRLHAGKMSETTKRHCKNIIGISKASNGQIKHDIKKVVDDVKIHEFIVVDRKHVLFRVDNYFKDGTPYFHGALIANNEDIARSFEQLFNNYCNTICCSNVDPN